MQDQPNPITQKQTHQQLKTLLAYYKQELKRTQQKLTQYQKQFSLYQKQQQKIAQLQKLNEEHSARLLQSVSNIRDLLHSNKTLRQELNREKYLRQVERKKGEQLRCQLQKLEEQQLRQGKYLHQEEDIQSVPHYLKSNKQINIHKLNKFQKLSKPHVTNSLPQNRHSLGNIQPQFHSPTSHNTKTKLKLINDRYRNNTQLGNNQVSNPQCQKINRISRSLSTKKEDKKYLKAQLRRKRSIYDSDQRMEMLQHKPLPSGLSQF